MRTPTFQLPSPSDVRFRSWSIDYDPAGMHLEVCTRLEAPDCPVPDVVSRVMLTIGRKPDGTLKDFSSAETLLLLERLTIRYSWYPTVPTYEGNVRYGALTVDRSQASTPSATPPEWYLFEAAYHDFRRQWVEECCQFQPFDRDAPALSAHDEVLQALQSMRRQSTRSRKGMGRILHKAVGADATITLGGRTYTLPGYWKTKIRPDASPSDCTLVILATAWQTNTRAVEERVTRARLEREIEATWIRYGHWLSEYPAQVQTLKDRLGGLPIQFPSGVVFAR